MLSRVPLSGCRRQLPACLTLMVLGLSLGCDTPTAVQEAKQREPRNSSSKGTIIKSTRTDGPPQVTATISRVKLNWKDRQQTFDLTLTNESDKPEIIHAIVYAKNDTVTPPRRGISPPTATDWFVLANSKDGKLTVADVERAWKSDAFQSARGGRLRKSWDVKLGPNSTEVVEAAHDLDEKSPHPQWKGKAMPNVGYSEYQLWLFTPEGQCFFEETWPANGPPPVRETKKTPDTRPADTKVADTKVADTKAADTKVADTKPADTKPAVQETKPAANSALESQAEKELKLASYYLERNRVQDARDKLFQILKKYPDTEAAKAARKMLKDLM